MHYLRHARGYQGHRIGSDPHNRIVHPALCVSSISFSFISINCGNRLRPHGPFWLQFRLQTSGEGNQVVTYGAGFCDRILERDVGNLCAAKHDKTAKLARVHQIDCSRSIAGGKHTVIGGWSSTTLGMSQIHRARFIARSSPQSTQPRFDQFQPGGRARRRPPWCRVWLVCQHRGSSRLPRPRRWRRACRARGAP